MGLKNFLTFDDLMWIKTNRYEAIALIRYYASQYKGGEHYEQLGATHVMSATKTVDTVIGSAKYLQGMFVMPDEIHVERLVHWLTENRSFTCDNSVLMFYLSSYIKKKINQLYRAINNNEFSTTLTVMGDDVARNELRKELNQRKKEGVKIIRS